ncbi:hypothetical protein [Aquitalea pelogenes]|uniref:hypothetical protein n=1 Tax=Aquitalea pelogenes TaxID=1293573 RepID=UPI000787DC2A|nr:hypothetical protein [Aquitalea pelogenes]
MHQLNRYILKKITILLISINIFNITKAGTIYTEGSDKIIITKIEEDTKLDNPLIIFHNNIQCDTGRTMQLTYAKTSSDGKFLIVNGVIFLNLEDIKKCNKEDDLIKHASVISYSFEIEDINEMRNLIALYIGPSFGMAYEKKSQFHYLAGVIVNEEIYGYGMRPDPLIINHKQFFSYDRTSNVDLDRSLFAGYNDKAFFSPDGKYLALKSSAISCKKGAYPGVFETTHWKQVIFNGPDSNKKCRALFPQLK